MNTNKPIKNFRDLYVYQNLYKAMIIVHTEIVPSLPGDEKYDLAGQMKRASKSAPALIAEGFAKRFLQRQWQKYINDTIGEVDEMIHHLSVYIDVYPQYVDVELCKSLNTQHDTCHINTQHSTLIQNKCMDYFKYVTPINIHLIKIIYMQ